MKEARRTYTAALSNGTLTRPEKCERCGDDGRIHGHHTDYAKPLSVVWLCTRCHSGEHYGLTGKQRSAVTVVRLDASVVAILDSIRQTMLYPISLAALTNYIICTIGPEYADPAKAAELFFARK